MPTFRFDRAQQKDAQAFQQHRFFAEDEINVCKLTLAAHA